MQYVEEELTIAEFSERFFGNADFKTPNVFDVENCEIEILSKNDNGDFVYVPIKSFIVKGGVTHYYTDGILKGTEHHQVVEDGKCISLKDHQDFKRVDLPMDVVDFEVSDTHTYVANGRLNHNTTSGGHGLKFHESVRLRLQQIGSISRGTDKSKEIIGIHTKVKVEKNRVGPPLRTCVLDIYFDRGIDRYGGWLTILKDAKIAEVGKKYITLGKLEIAKNEWNKTLTENEEIRNEVYQMLCDKFIMKYKTDKTETIDDVVISNDDAE